MLNQMEMLMTPYALYPLTNKRVVTHQSSFDGDISIVTYKAVKAIGTAGKWLVRRYRRSDIVP